jgi:hypothetical protein
VHDSKIDRWAGDVGHCVGDGACGFACCAIGDCSVGLGASPCCAYLAEPPSVREDPARSAVDR